MENATVTSDACKIPANNISEMPRWVFSAL